MTVFFISHNHSLMRCHLCPSQYNSAGRSLEAMVAGETHGRDAPQESRGPGLGNSNFVLCYLKTVLYF